MRMSSVMQDGRHIFDLFELAHSEACTQLLLVVLDTTTVTMYVRTDRITRISDIHYQCCCLPRSHPTNTDDLVCPPVVISFSAIHSARLSPVSLSYCTAVLHYTTPHHAQPPPHTTSTSHTSARHG